METEAKRDGRPGNGVRLTPAEIAVFKQLLRGEGTKTAAAALGISPATVRNHVQNMLVKTGEHSRIALVTRWAHLVHGDGDPRSRVPSAVRPDGS